MIFFINLKFNAYYYYSRHYFNDNIFIDFLLNLLRELDVRQIRAGAHNYWNKLMDKDKESLLNESIKTYLKHNDIIQN